MIDAYCHCGVSKYRPVEDVLQTLQHVGVERAVLCQHLGEYNNDYLARVVKKHRRQFAAVCLVDPASSKWEHELRHNVAAGFHGIRIVADTLGQNPALCVEAMALGLTLVLYTPETVADAVAPIRRLMSEALDAKVVVTHLGCPQVESERMVAGWELLDLAAESGVFVTLSGLSMFCEYPYAPLAGFITEVVQSFGPHRIMWGSNYPVCGDADAYQRDLTLTCSDVWGFGSADVRAITHDTADRLWFGALGAA